jgi:GTPase SAR1 family protein
VQLYTVPGQVFYDATRKLVLRGTDGIVFVADSQTSMRESNLDSLENLKTNLRVNRIDPGKVAIVFQYNKRDLPDVDSVEDMTEYLDTGNAPVVEASAIQGAGVTATLRAAITRFIDNLKNGVDVSLSAEPPLAAPDMTVRSGAGAGAAKKVSTREAAAFAEEDPFATVAVAEAIDRADVESLLAGARELVRSLEAALAKAREQERALAQKLQ